MKNHRAQREARDLLQRSQHTLSVLHERTASMQQQETEPRVMVSPEQARYVLTKAQRAIAALEALDPLTFSEAEQEAWEHTLEQMHAVAHYVRTSYPGVFPLLLVMRESKKQTSARHLETPVHKKGENIHALRSPH